MSKCYRADCESNSAQERNNCLNHTHTRDCNRVMSLEEYKINFLTNELAVTKVHLTGVSEQRDALTKERDTLKEALRLAVEQAALHVSGCPTAELFNSCKADDRECAKCWNDYFINQANTSPAK